MTGLLDGPTEKVGEAVWRDQLPSTGIIRIGLLHFGPAVPIDLHVFADVLTRASTCTALPSLQVENVNFHLSKPVEFNVVVIASRLASAISEADIEALRRMLGNAKLVFFLGPAVAWFAETDWASGMRVALHWRDAEELDLCDSLVNASSAIIEVSGKWTTCCGAAATLDLGIAFVRDVFGSPIADRVQADLCIERVREPCDRQCLSRQSSANELAPKLAEAVLLMETNLEEPLMTEDIARLVGLSRRQLERLFKKQFDTVPSRYYIELRLSSARNLVREARHSLLEIALMCGFSSGSHFASSYNMLFDITPREERQRALRRSS